MPSDQLTRRMLIGSGAAAATALVVGPFASLRVAHAANPVGTFVLDPTQGGTCTVGSCAPCQACQLHAANKLFQTADAADLGRDDRLDRGAPLAGRTRPSDLSRLSVRRTSVAHAISRSVPY